MLFPLEFSKWRYLNWYGYQKGLNMAQSRNSAAIRFCDLFAVMNFNLCLHFLTDFQNFFFPTNIHYWAIIACYFVSNMISNIGQRADLYRTLPLIFRKFPFSILYKIFIYQWNYTNLVSNCRYWQGLSIDIILNKIQAS